MCDGEIWVARECLSRIIDAMALTGPPHPDFPDVRALDVLTEREREVAKLVAEGLHNKAIAARLGIAENTVGHHLTSIYAKLCVFDRVELAIRYLPHSSDGGAKA